MTTDHDTCAALAAWLNETPEEEDGMGTDCPCGHPRDDHERYVGCLAPTNWLAADVPFCACSLEYDPDARQQQRRADGAGGVRGEDGSA